MRICSEPETRDLRLSELKEMLLSRNYKPKIIDSAVERARAVPRVKALERVSRESSNSRQVFAVTYESLRKSSNVINTVVMYSFILYYLFIRRIINPCYVNLIMARFVYVFFKFINWGGNKISHNHKLINY